MRSAPNWPSRAQKVSAWPIGGLVTGRTS